MPREIRKKGPSSKGGGGGWILPGRAKKPPRSLKETARVKPLGKKYLNKIKAPAIRLAKKGKRARQGWK